MAVTDLLEDGLPPSSRADDDDEGPEAPGGLHECPVCGRDDFKSAQGVRRHVTVAHGPEAPDPDGDPDDDDDGGDGGGDGVVERERPPLPPRRDGGLVGRIRGRWRSGKSAPGPGPARTGKAAARKRTPARNRVSTADDWCLLFRDLSKRLEYSPHYPTGRILKYEAPAAGVVLDRAIAGTAVDRYVVQPIWRSKDRWEEPFFLLAPPMLTFSIQSARMQQFALAQEGRTVEAQQLQGRINAGMEMLAWTMRRSLVRLAPAIAEARAQEEAENEAIRDAFPELAALYPEVDPVQALLSDLFAPPAQPGSFHQEANHEQHFDHDSDGAAVAD